MKQGRLQKTVSVLLAVSVLLCLMPWTALPVQAADAQLQDILEPQIRAYAASIKQDNTDEAAAWLLARHGITEQGNTLVADGTHPLTALLMNTELVQASFAELLTQMLSTAQELDADRVYADGSCVWTNENKSYSYQLTLPESNEDSNVTCDSYTGETTSYDTMLKWLAGEIAVEVTLEKAEVREKTVAYDVHVRFSDHFVFDPNINTDSISIALLALLTSTMFVDYDWEASTVFELEVPHSCTHRVPNYHWTYDAQQGALLSDTSDGYVGNEASQISLENGAYYRLERDVVLRHTDSWVLEYSVKNPNTFALASGGTADTEIPCFLNFSRLYLFFACEAADGTGTDYYGTSLIGLFRYNAADTYTIRLENAVAEDGSNTIWLTIRNATQDITELEPIPMDDRYVIENGFWVRREAESDGLSGRDFTIRYIGTEAHGLAAEVFELTVLGNGHGDSGESWFTTAVVEPTCEDRGYIAHTCAMCGYTYADTWVEAYGHSWSEWEILEEATQTTAGLRRRVCGHCGKTEEEVIPKTGVMYGDLSGDGHINSLDVILMRRLLAGWEIEVDTAAADVNGDGTVNSLDMILLRQYMAGWDVTLGP